MSSTQQPSPASTDPLRAVEVFYDGACPVCRREIAFYRDRIPPEHIQWRDITASADDPAPDLGRDAALGRFHVRLADGQLSSGAPAFLALWRNLPTLRPIARLMTNPPMLWLAERAYRGFLILRRAWRPRRVDEACPHP